MHLSIEEDDDRDRYAARRHRELRREVFVFVPLEDADIQPVAGFPRQAEEDGQMRQRIAAPVLGDDEHIERLRQRREAGDIFRRDGRARDIRRELLLVLAHLRLILIHRHAGRELFSGDCHWLPPSFACGRYVPNRTMLPLFRLFPMRYTSAHEILAGKIAPRTSRKDTKEREGERRKEEASIPSSHFWSSVPSAVQRLDG